MNIRNYLQEQGISILELSRNAKIAPSDLCQALDGKRPFFPNWRKRVAQALNIPEDELFPEYTQKEGE